LPSLVGAVVLSAPAMASIAATGALLIPFAFYLQAVQLFKIEVI
jgi:hypothetical protein